MSHNDKAPIGVNTSQWLYPVYGVFDKEADAMRKKIMEAPDTLTVSGKTWYVSEQNGNDDNDGSSPQKAIKTIDGMNARREQFEVGDAVLFERGGVYRGYFMARDGVSYGAYGTGEKPCLYGSRRNLAKVEWKKTEMENIWKCEGGTSDIGNLIFEHGKHIGVKKLVELKSVRRNFDFYYEDGDLYLYFDKGNPADHFQSIEGGEKSCVIQLPYKGQHNTVIENVTVKYAGAHGIGADQTKNCTIRNCEIGWIGGSKQGKTVRYGNGIEFWAACDNMLVENCWIYQCYDTGFTFQTSAGGGAELNITFRNNLVECCWYSTEMWNCGKEGTDNRIENILLEGNLMRFAGYGWGAQRYDPVNASHMFNMSRQAKNFVVKNNIFEGSVQSLLYPDGAEFDGNTYVQHCNTNYRSLGIDREGKTMAFNENAEQQIREKWGDQNPTVIYAEI